MTTNLPSALDQLLNKQVQGNGVQAITRPAANFIGSGVSVVDNPGNNSTDITINSGGAFGKANLTLANGTNSNKATDGSLLQIIGGPTAAFALGSVLPSVSLLSGQPVVFAYAGTQTWSVVHLDPAATGSSLKFAIPGQTAAGSVVQYSGSVSVYFDGAHLVVNGIIDQTFNVQKIRGIAGQLRFGQPNRVQCRHRGQGRGGWRDGLHTHRDVRAIRPRRSGSRSLPSPR